MNEETMTAREHHNQLVSEALEAQLKLFSKRSKHTDELAELLYISKEIRDLAILLAGVRRLDLARMGYDGRLNEYRA